MGTPAAHGTGQSRLEAAVERATQAAVRWRRQALDPEDPWLLSVADVGVAAEVILADRLFRDLSAQERSGLLAGIRAAQAPSGAWHDPTTGAPDLSLTSLGWWACVEAGDDPQSERLVRALRVVHELGGAQRASFAVRLWLAIAGRIPWSWLPAVPAELWLLPPSNLFSPSRVCPWARGMLTPYLLLTRAPARVHLCDASPLLIMRDDKAIPPRITSDGLVGDLVQNFDTAIKVLRKLPRGPLLSASMGRAQGWLGRAQQAHGGWFSVRPTLLSLLAHRVAGANFDDGRIRRGLDYLRHARGRARATDSAGEPGRGEVVLHQGLTGAPITALARLTQATAARDEDAIPWLLAQELSEPGEWQNRTNAPAGGWPIESGARHHLDVDATAAVAWALLSLPKESPHRAPAWAAMRRALEVLVAMQEPDGSFARYERGEDEVWMTQAPWRDADLLADRSASGEAKVKRTADVLRMLARMGWRADDDRVARGMRWLENHARRDLGRDGVETLAALARCAADLYRPDHALRQQVERHLRGRQLEDGSFGGIVATAQALDALVTLEAKPCVQAIRAARRLVAAIEGGDPGELPGATVAGHGLSPTAYDPSAGVREAAIALRAFADSGGVL
jgi:hypothetical protein